MQGGKQPASKYLLLVGDGMGDEPQESLGGMTPLQAANTPNMDAIAAAGVLGITETIPRHQDPGSDVANMAILGYDPDKYHTGRAPLEAASMGVDLDEDDVAFRCNLVTVEPGPDGELVLRDYAAGHISSEEGAELIRALDEAFGGDAFSFYPGVSYRHLLVWHGGMSELAITPPHDVSGEPVGPYWRTYEQAPALATIIQRAREVLQDHEINRRRRQRRQLPANAIWLWGQGKRPQLPTIQDLYGLRGVAISAVDLIRGLGVCAGLQPVTVAGATGYIDTNYENKVAAALAAFEVNDLVFVHVEAPDECSHEGNLELKIKAIEDFDRRVVGPLLQGGGGSWRLRLLLITDHLTPLRIRTHAHGPVPFAVAELPLTAGAAGRGYSEAAAAATGLMITPAHRLMAAFIDGSILQADPANGQ